MAATALALIAVTATAAAQPPKTTREGTPPAEFVNIRFGDVLLRVPVGFAGDSPEARKWRAERPRLGFSFWMPDRRRPEQPFQVHHPFRPQEVGRPRPPHDAHIVGVHELRPADRADPKYVSPEQMHRNRTSYPGPSSYSEEMEAFGLIRFWRHDLPVGEREASMSFRTADGADPAGLFSCTAWHRPEIARCRAEVHYGTEKIHAKFDFAREYLPQWRAIVTAIFEMYVSWKVPDSR
jgi:hypothetical protein